MKFLTSNDYTIYRNDIEKNLFVPNQHFLQLIAWPFTTLYPCIRISRGGGGVEPRSSQIEDLSLYLSQLHSLFISRFMKRTCLSLFSFKQFFDYVLIHEIIFTLNCFNVSEFPIARFVIVLLARLSNYIIAINHFYQNVKKKNN
ncbi:hypothetical protein C1646_694704 [Rhizophagus diaphanus]|nr:hypothetical protein C1646_694704 [Rhizophagus diaphanus] [Rhizophagus sp. MUCL 43196]